MINLLQYIALKSAALFFLGSFGILLSKVTLICSDSAPIAESTAFIKNYSSAEELYPFPLKYCTFCVDKKDEEHDKDNLDN